jgi:hypothetical protein
VAAAGRPSRVAIAYAALGVGVLALLLVWESRSYVEYSDGVYAATSRELLHHVGLYDDVAAAQPPLLYLVGEALLRIHDSVVALRIGLSAAMLATGGLVAASVWRLTARAPVAVAAGVLSLLTPWQLREHAALLPETLAAPVLLGAALAASHSRRGPLAAGLLGAVATMLKLAFLLPAAAVVLAGRRRLGGVASLALGVAVASGLALAVYGSDLYRNIVEAQVQRGGTSARYVFQLWGQAAWNAVPLLLLAVPAIRRRATLRDPVLARTLLVLVAGSAVLLVTVVKRGTFLQPLMLLEPPAIALAAAGLSAWWEERRRAPAAIAAAGVATAVIAIQSVSLLADPTDPWLFSRPGSSQRYGWDMRTSEVDRQVRLARRCPPGRPYSSAPYLAFAAKRRMPGRQPDLYILGADVNSHFARAAAADQPRCP